MHLRTVQHLHYGGQKSYKTIAVYDSETLVTMKQGQGHQTWYGLVDPKQGSNNAKFENLRLNSVHEKNNDKVFAKSGNISIISLQSKIVGYFWPAWGT